MKAALGKMFGAVGRFLTHKSVRHAAMICAVFGLAIGGGAYMAHRNTSQLGSSPPPELAVRSDNITGAGSMKDDDPVKNFTRTGVGHVLFAGSGTNNCKRTLFDNKTGSYRVVNDVNCGTTGDQAVDEKKSEQLDSMRRAFKR